MGGTLGTTTEAERDGAGMWNKTEGNETVGIVLTFTSLKLNLDAFASFMIVIDE